MAEIKSMLDEVIEEEIQNLDTRSNSDPEKKSAAIRDLTQLHKLRIEEIKAQAEVEEKRERRALDSKKNDAEIALKEREATAKDADRAREERALIQQAQENKIDRCIKVAVAGVELVVPLAFYGVWMRKGFKFEETGSFTSTTFKNLLNRFRPTK